MPKSKPIARDARDYDTTSLHAGMDGAKLHRDYSAHFFRWSFARRFIKTTDHVLEIGCGVERPLWRILFTSTMPRAAGYVGVDLNELRGGVGMNHKLTTLLGGFNFVERWKELNRLAVDDAGQRAGFDVVVHLEVIEHMKVEHGAKLLKGAFGLLRPGGVMLMSTPCYDGKRHAANHIHEYTVPELQKAVEKAGFVVEQRFGTFMDVRELKKSAPVMPDVAERQGFDPSQLREAVPVLAAALGAYYDNDALSCFFAPLFPDHARNNLWVCRRPE